MAANDKRATCPECGQSGPNWTDVTVAEWKKIHKRQCMGRSSAHTVGVTLDRENKFRGYCDCGFVTRGCRTRNNAQAAIDRHAQVHDTAKGKGDN